MSEDGFESEEEFYASIVEYSAISKVVGCSAKEVGVAFSGIENPQMFTRGSLFEFRELVKIIEDAGEAAATMINMLDKLDPLHLDVDGKQVFPDTNIHKIQIEINANITFEQVRHFVDALKVYGLSFQTTQSRLSRDGGSEPAANLVLEGLSRLFVSLGRPITYGHSAGNPNTEFCRAAETAFAEFRVKTKWRSKTQRWYAKRNHTQ